MFDDKPTNLNQTPLVTDQPPQNLPTAAKEEFETPPTATPPAEPEDILAEVEKVEKEDLAVRRPATSRPDLTASVPPAVSPPEKPITKEPFFKQHKKAFLVIVLLLLVGGALAGGGWYGYRLFISSSLQPAKPATNVNQPAVNVNQPVNANQPISPLEQDINIVPLPPVDTDRDGLDDEEEALYGTDPLLVDTDGDGLTDRDEVKVFKTDPNNLDTDGDGYLDGEEVRAGYDPKGPGRLLEIE